jgi:hypothetical protein
MATVVSATLSGANVADTVPIRVLPVTYASKSGLLKLTITSYAWTGSNTTDKQFDIRVPNYCPHNDTAVVDNVVTTTASGTTSVGTDYYYAINKGVPGPSVGFLPDGSWNLMNCAYQLTNGATASALTVTYTVTFLDFDDLGGSPTPGTADFSTTWLKLFDSKMIGVDAADYVAFGGAVALVMVSLENVTTEGDYLDFILNQGVYPVNFPANTSPQFAVATSPTPGGAGSVRPVEQLQYVDVATGTKTFTANLDKFIIAFNAGKIDGNGVTVETPLGSVHVLAVAAMSNNLSFFTYNDVAATLNYTTQDMEV